MTKEYDDEFEDPIEEELDEDFDSEATGDKPYNASRQRLFVLFPLILILGVIIFGVVKLIIWNKGDKYTDKYEKVENIEDVIYETEDYYTALDKKLVEGRTDDDTYILFLGDGTLTYGDETIPEMVQKGTGATVYNCGFEGSTYARESKELTLDTCNDVFSFISLATCILANDYTMVDYYKTYAPIYNESFEENINLLKSVDFNDVDVIFLCYGTQDYLNVRKTSDIVDSTAMDSMTGALTLGVNAIHEKYPHIRFVVVSPVFCYYTEEDGTLTPGDQRFVGVPESEQSLNNLDTWGFSYEHLGGYIDAIKSTCYSSDYSYLDCYMGTPLHAETAADYLDDAYHVNGIERQAIADKIIDFIKYHMTYI